MLTYIAGNGTISVREMVTCLNAMGKKVTYDEVLDRFHRIDKDGNHEVDYNGEYLLSYGTTDEALAPFSWLKMCSGEVSQDWDNF